MWKNSATLLMLGVLLFALGVLPACAQPPNNADYDRAKELVEAVRTKKTTPAKLLAEGKLDKSLLLRIVGDESLIDVARGLWSMGMETYLWAGFAIEKFPEILDELAFRDYPTRIRLANALFQKNDARGAEIMEKVIAEQPRENADKQVLIAALYNLAGYYRSNEKYEKAKATYLKVRDYDTTPEEQSNLILSVARAAYAMGDKEGAQDLYEEVIGIGYGWTTGHAHSDMAEHFFQEGKLEEGRASLKAPIEGLNADQFRVILNHELARSYVTTGEWGEARKWAQAAIEQYKSLVNPIQNHGLEYFVSESKQLLEEVKKWQANPIELSAPKVEITAPKTASGKTALYAAGKTFSVSSYQFIDPRVVSDNPLVTVSVQPLSTVSYDRGNRRIILVEIAPTAFGKELKSQIAITFPEFPGITLRVPVTLQKAER